MVKSERKKIIDKELLCSTSSKQVALMKMVKSERKKKSATQHNPTVCVFRPPSNVITNNLY